MSDRIIKMPDGTVFTVSGDKVTIKKSDQPEITLPVETLLAFVNYHLYQ